MSTNFRIRKIKMTEKNSKIISLISLGCPKNLVDAEMMLGFLKQEGFSFSANPQEADVVIVNTCGFVEDSKTESINKILEMAELKKTARCKVLVATGCLTQRYARQLEAELPEIDAFVGLGEFDRIGRILREGEGHQGEGDRLFINQHPESKTPSDLSSFTTRRQILPDPDLPRVLSTPGHFSYVKISEGCSHRCSFCIIPHIRGDLKSRRIASIVREVQQGLGKGVREFNLIAQDLNEYGKDLRDGTNLTGLLKELDQIKGDFWIRPLYMYPLEFTDGLVAVLRNSGHLVKYVDMPLQHINARVMRSMKRGSPARYVRQILGKLKKAIPEIAIRTTFIVGYPGETKAEFDELYQFVKEYEFHHVGVFRYSPEEDTLAAALPGQIAPEEKDERFHRLMSLQQGISLKKNKRLVGKALPALLECISEEKPGYLEARLGIQAPEIDGITYVKASQGMRVGDFCEVKIVEAAEYDLVGE
ncbi:MAG: 30S ribosomal protein S12 methylthiotransferase RimO [Deltaproteobacteria bacterium]|nr:30S ribosomal protein S12 methylthiotransferase RimO [Deltaproteobacteria bacterium]